MKCMNWAPPCGQHRGQKEAPSQPSRRPEPTCSPSRTAWAGTREGALCVLGPQEDLGCRLAPQSLPLTPAEGQHLEPGGPPAPPPSAPLQLPGEGVMRQGCQRAWPRVRVAFGFSIKASVGGGPCGKGQRLARGIPCGNPPRSLLLSCGRGSLCPRGPCSRSLCLHGAGLKC